MKQITHGTTHNQKRPHRKKNKLTPNIANNLPIFSLKSMGLVKIFNKKSKTYTIPRVKRHYHILTNPQTHKANTKPNPHLTNTQTKYQT